jgi:hypothetical protein
MYRSILSARPAIILAAAVWLAAPVCAQNSDFDLNVHANSHATAKDIGLPVYPGATPFKENSNLSSAELGFLLNSFHISVQAASFVTKDSLERVLAFYRKPLAILRQRIADIEAVQRIASI